jgi:hypothetical protein
MLLKYNRTRIDAILIESYLQELRAQGYPESILEYDQGIKAKGPAVWDVAAGVVVKLD